MWQEVEGVITKANKTVLAVRTRQLIEWFAEQCKLIVETKRHLRQEILARNNNLEI